MEITMRYRLSIIATSAVLITIVDASASELPTFELLGFPVSRHQVAVLGSANIEEQAPSPTLTWGGMPASPHQVAVLTPRPRVAEKAAVTSKTVARIKARAADAWCEAVNNNGAHSWQHWLVLDSDVERCNSVDDIERARVNQ